MFTSTIDEIDISFRYFGLEPSVSLAAAKEAYRRYVKEFHPDKFPAGSDAQKMSAEKMIAANAHFEKLKKFFQEFPNGKPEASGSTRQEPHNDSDWEAWEKQRHNAFENELKEWQARQAAIEKEKGGKREGFRRKKLVFYVRVGLVLATLAMWKGWASECSKLDQLIGQQEYQQQLLDSNYGNDPTHEAWIAHTSQYRVDPRQQENEQSGKMIQLLIWTGAAGWFLLSKKGKAMAENYLAKATN
ncbi:MAG TPA: hypothetical protein V6C69_14765 [Trichormus sp.]